MVSNLPFANTTLDEALVAFRAQSGLTDKYDAMSEEAQTFFERHDMIHVLFGLDTSLRQEAQADGWTLLATDISWQDVRYFMQLPEEKALLEDLGWRALVMGFLRAVPDYAAMAWRSRKIKKRWRWADNAQYRGVRVAEIRAEFGIDAALA